MSHAPMVVTHCIYPWYPPMVITHVVVNQKAINFGPHFIKGQIRPHNVVVMVFLILNEIVFECYLCFLPLSLFSYVGPQDPDDCMFIKMIQLY